MHYLDEKFPIILIGELCSPSQHQKILDRIIFGTQDEHFEQFLSNRELSSEQTTKFKLASMSH